MAFAPAFTATNLIPFRVRPECEATSIPQWQLFRGKQAIDSPAFRTSFRRRQSGAAQGFKPIPAHTSPHDTLASKPAGNLLSRNVRTDFGQRITASKKVSTFVHARLAKLNPLIHKNLLP
jgi:hypothetical protein